jgi:hypothetical protein
MEKPESEKKTHAEVHYEHPSRHSGEFCAGCRHFIRANPRRCQGVKRPIAGPDWCRNYSPGGNR